MSANPLPLRDVHLPPAPAWWPPAPGWWLAAGAVLLLLAAVLGWRWHRRRRVRQWRAMFAAAEGAADSPPARLAAISVLLRRAGRRLDPAADTLQGEAWLRFLDGGKGTAFSQGVGRLLLDGGFRREIDATDYLAARDLAQARFLQLMAGRR